MANLEISTDRMERERVARFADTKPSRVDWHDDVIRRAQAAGFALDEDGNIQEV